MLVQPWETRVENEGKMSDRQSQMLSGGQGKMGVPTARILS